MEQGKPYYHAFVDTYPTVHDLAAATEEEVLRLWQGLGYYSRARNLHACAKQVVDKHDGRFPETYEELLTLKGVGKYTAAAIASFAFGEAVPVVDGNVFRFFSRVFGIQTDIASSGAFKEFFSLGLELIDQNQPGNFNQAAMEFGATYCKPRNPPCLTCVLAEHCHANATSTQHLLPVKSKKTKVRNRYFNYLVFYYEDKVLVRQRPQGDIWTGLYDFFLVETEVSEKPNLWDSFLHDGSPDLILGEPSEEYKHLLSHQRLHARFFPAQTGSLESLEQLAQQHDLQAVSLTELENIPKPVLILRYLNDVQF